MEWYKYTFFILQPFPKEAMFRFITLMRLTCCVLNMVESLLFFIIIRTAVSEDVAEVINNIKISKSKQPLITRNINSENK